jgi:hypothetical protein
MFDIVETAGLAVDSAGELRSRFSDRRPPSVITSVLYVSVFLCRSEPAYGVKGEQKGSHPPVVAEYAEYDTSPGPKNLNSDVPRLRRGFIRK